MDPHTTHIIRRVVLGGWIVLVLGVLYFYFFKHDALHGSISAILAASPILGYGIYLVLGCLRGITLIPLTYLIIVGMMFLSPVPLYILTVVGAVASSACVYYFSDFLHISEFLERKHPKGIAQVKTVLQKNELPIIIAWSFFPFAPTDVICYVCGDLEVDIKKFLIGIIIGEGVACAIYIFLGEKILRFFPIHF